MELNPFSYAFHDDPYPTYRWLRDHAPVYHNEALRFYALSRYEDVLAASIDHGTYSSAKGTVLEMEQTAVEAAPMIIFMDPPRQTRLRRLVSGAFSPRRIAELEPIIRTLTVGFIDRLYEAGRGDYIRDAGTSVRTMRPTFSTSSARSPWRSPSATGRTNAWARRSPGSRAGSPSRNSTGARPTTRSTSPGSSGYT
jgi:hypothetical protein